MAEIPQRNEKTFKHFLEAPPELRMMIIDDMRPDDRCRFSGCSKLSNKEAKSSKNYMYGLKFNLIDSVIHLEVKYSPDDPNQGFRFRFMDVLGNKYVKCETLTNRELGTNQLDWSTNLVDFAIHQFKQVLQHYQSIIKWLNIFISRAELDLRSIDFGVRSLNNLTFLVLYNVPNSEQFLLKTRKDLDYLDIVGNPDNEIITGCEMVYRVRDTIGLPNTSFTRQQFSQLSAERWMINIGELSVEDIFDFIKSWQQRMVTKDFRCYYWILNRSRFDVDKLFRLFGEDHNNMHHYRQITIKHDWDAQKVALLKHTNSGGLRRIGFINPLRPEY